MRYKIIEKQVIEGVVAAVHDGDSIKVVFPKETVWVRLYGCDAPEVISNHVTANQPFGVDSGKQLRELAKGNKVIVETLFRDIYNRMICKVTLVLEDPNTEDLRIDLTEYMISNGLAWWLSEPKMSSETKEKYKALHNTAKASKNGLWGISGRKMKPATWRKYHKRFTAQKLYEDLW